MKKEKKRRIAADTRLVDRIQQPTLLLGSQLATVHAAKLFINGRRILYWSKARGKKAEAFLRTTKKGQEEFPSPANSPMNIDGK
jgi:hypothetical protein